MAGARELPNILWYCTDQQRWDTVHALGNQHIHTPSLDALLERGVAFRRAYTQSPICTPSRASFMTGRYPATHHVHRNGNAYFPPHEVLVSTLLADAGYECALIGKLHLSTSKTPETRPPNDGFRLCLMSHGPRSEYPDAYTDWLTREKGIDPRELLGTPQWLNPAGVPAQYHQTTWCSEMAIRFITEKRAGPWLVCVNPLDPHIPFDPPKEYFQRYDPERLPPPLFRRTDIDRQNAFRDIDQQVIDAIDPTSSPASTEERSGAPGRGGSAYTRPTSHYDGRFVKAAYYAMIELIDDQLARILDALRSSGQLDNTVVLFMSDHGELLGDHGLICKGCRFFDGLVRVPLIFSWPARAVEGLVSDALVELVDVAPTLLECAGLEVPYFMQGKSLLPILSGRSDPSRHKSHVVCEYNDALDLPNHTHGSMSFDGRHKIAVYSGHDIGEIYDLLSDPGEFENLWSDVDGRDLKLTLLKRHLDIFMSTSSAGIRRVAGW